MSAELTCGEARAHASSRLDDALDPSRVAALDEHLAECAACRRFADELRAQRAELRALPLEVMPDELLERIWARTLRAADPATAPGAGTSKSRRGRPGRWPWLLAAAAALLVAALLLPIGLHGPGRAPEDPALARDMEELKLALSIAGSSLRRAQGSTSREVLGEAVGGSLERAEEVTASRVLQDELMPSLLRVPLETTPAPERGRGGEQEQDGTITGRPWS